MAKARLTFKRFAPETVPDEQPDNTAKLATIGVLAIFAIVALVVFFDASITGQSWTIERTCWEGSVPVSINEVNSFRSVGYTCVDGFLPNVKCCHP